jgi:hypothetical protein
MLEKLLDSRYFTKQMNVLRAYLFVLLGIYGRNRLKGLLITLEFLIRVMDDGHKFINKLLINV